MADELQRLLKHMKLGENIPRVELEVLSDLSRQEWVQFSDVWPEVPISLRRKVIHALALLTRERFEFNFDRVFREALIDEDAHVRSLAIQGLWECEDIALISSFIEMLVNDPDEQVRGAAAAGLGRFVYLGEMQEIDEELASKVEETLISEARNPRQPFEVRRHVVESVGYSCNPVVRGIIQDAFDNESPLMKASALQAMGRSADRHWGSQVIQELVHSEEEVRLQAICACGELELRESVPHLARSLDTESELSLRLAIVRSLGQVGGKTARRLLETVLQSGEEPLYDAVQEALEELTFAEECPEIIELLHLADIDETDLDFEFGGHSIKGLDLYEEEDMGSVPGAPYVNDAWDDWDEEPSEGQQCAFDDLDSFEEEY